MNVPHLAPLPQHAIAYYCMEFGLHERLPIYAGGLGILAGDILKAAKDLDKPLIGIGIFWSEGYTIQQIDEHGEPIDAWVPTPRGALRDTGVEVMVTIQGRQVPVIAWRVDTYGNVPLLLLEPRLEDDRWMSARLYGGGDDARVAQEILLGVGGVRVLEALDIDVDLHHFNEGHAVFAGVELLKQELRDGVSFEDAMAVVRKRCIFTTHTPVPAGNEVHPLDRLVHMGVTGRTITRDTLAQIGGDPFEMTPAALRLSCQANAVAELHGNTARGMWADIDGAAPIHSITNGVHMPTWQDPELRRLRAEEASDPDLWSQHQRNKADLIEEIRLRTSVSLDPDVMLIGFARRAATYKRATLVLRDLEWLVPLLDQHRFQIVFSGKAHPRDQGGKQLIREISQIARSRPGQIVFLDAYDMVLGRKLTRGCDVWLNNPRRPMEASGTSGMKAAANGILNVSILDGWWDEGCEHGENGWGFGDRMNAHNEGDDRRDLDALKALLTDTVLPTFYEDRSRWIAMMRNAMETAETRFSARRMVQTYFELMYGPALAAQG